MEAHYSSDSEQQYAAEQSKREEGSRRREMCVERNSEEEQQIVIPYWDEESASQLRLAEENQLLRSRNRHFESHMSRMKREYEQLRMNLEQMDESEREHIRRYADLSARYAASVTKAQ
jgi:hypothetical protein